MAQPGSYNGPTARLCAELSFLAYALPGEIRRRVPQFVPNAKIHMRTGILGNSRVLFIAGETENFIVFRGTVASSVRSIVPNLKIARKRVGNGLVHRGFLTLYRRAEPFLTQQLRAHQGTEKPLYFTGHSQGAAVTYLGSMAFLSKQGLPDPGAIYSFGQPRAGNAAYVRDSEHRLGRRFSRLANGKDIVVGVPFVWMGYDHSRDYLHYGRNGKISRQTRPAGSGWPFFTASLHDHSMLQYLRRSQMNETGPMV